MLDPFEAYTLDLQGYLVVKQALSPALVDRLRDALVALEQAGREGAPADCPASWTPVVNEVRFLNVLAADPAFAELIDHPAILSRVGAVVPGPQRLTEAYSISRGRGPGLELHSIETARYRSDAGQPRCDHLTAAVALSDCGPEDGPFVAFAGSHRLGVPFPYATVHPGWEVPAHDREFAAARLARQPVEARDVPWEEVPGYTEVCVEAGDVVLFVQSLWHGAKELRSARVRRSLFFSYSPYHCCNWHGIEWSDELKARLSPGRRELLEGPFLGTRYPGVRPPSATEDARFTTLPDSDRGPRSIDVDSPVDAGGRDQAAACAALARRFEQAVAAYDPCACDAIGISGSCRFEVLDCAKPVRSWCLTSDADGSGLVLSSTNEVEVDAVVEAASTDLAAVLLDGRDPGEMFHNGRVRLRGNVALAMRLASVLRA